MDEHSLDGEWKVVVEGPWADLLNFWGDHKIISGAAGYNRVGVIKFGYFSISSMGHWIKLDYNDKRNPERLRGIVDILQKISDTEYKGTLYNNGATGFTFSLTKVEPGN